MKKKIIYNLSYDLENIKKFQHIDWHSFHSEHFKCVICGQECDLANSFSNQGHKLICYGCYREKFDSKIGSLDYWRKH